MVFTQKFLTFGFLLLGLNPFLSFTISQILASLLYAFLFIRSNPFVLFETYKNSFLELSLLGIDNNHLNLLKTITFHSFLKQFLTDGSNFLMTFTDFLSLREQAVYDAVERLGSLVVRLVLQPIEESAAIYFGINIKRGGNKIAGYVFDTFLLLIRLITSFGAFILVYGSSYAKLAAVIYGGTFFIENKADQLLFWYSIYLPVIAINGISECFNMALLSTAQVALHAKFFTLSIVIHFTLSHFISKLLGTKGFIIANILSYLSRICFNWWFIRNACLAAGLDRENIRRKLSPSIYFIASLLFSWIILSLYTLVVAEPISIASETIHVFIGTAMLALNGYAFYKNDFAHFNKVKLK